MSALSVFEVKVGIRRGEEHATNTLLNGIASIAVDRSLASKAAEYARTYKTRGITLELVDSMLAATAVLNNFTLVTLNVLHFPMPEIRLLHVAR